MALFFIPTNSVDATCDTLVRICRAKEIDVFRWNIDLWHHYQIVVTPQSMTVIDPTGRSVDLGSSDVFLLWRKPFTDLMSFEAISLAESDREHARAQMGQWMQALVAFMMSRGRVRLIEPYADRRVPKLFQLMQARNFLDVPKSVFSIQNRPADIGPMVVTKPLGNPKVGESNVLYTNYVNTDELIRPYPWLVQEALVEGTDVTCVHILGKNYFYECSFTRNKSAVDWRTEINTESQSDWRPLEYLQTNDLSDSVSALMQRMKVHFGRLDFIRQKNKMFFLECNTNGQFGWLDDPETLHLHHRFIEAAASAESRVA